MNQLANTLLLASAIPIVIGVLVVIAGLIAAYFVTRMMKGKIELGLPKTGFNSGEAVNGSVKLTAKKSLDLRRLYVALIGYQIVERIDSDGEKKTRKNEIHRDEINLEEGKPIPGGFQKTYEFSLVAPGNNSGASATGAEPHGKLASAVGSAVQALGAMGALGSNSRRFEWKVEARADLPGVDIATSKKVQINLM